jgi:hypothetical protein
MKTFHEILAEHHSKPGKNTVLTMDFKKAWPEESFYDATNRIKGFSVVEIEIYPKKPKQVHFFIKGKYPDVKKLEPFVKDIKKMFGDGKIYEIVQ